MVPNKNCAQKKGFFKIACGKCHTLAFVPSRGRLYSFGLGGAGQLGTSCNESSMSPQVVHGPWVSPKGESAMPEKIVSANSYKLLKPVSIFL